MRPPVDPFNKAFRVCVGKEIKAARLKREMTLEEVSQALNYTFPTAGNLEYGRASLDKVIKASEYFGIDYEKIASDLRIQMDIHPDTDFLLTGDSVMTDYRVGGKNFKIIGTIVRAINPYANVKIIEVTQDGGLRNVLPNVHRIAVHKTKVKSMG